VITYPELLLHLTSRKDVLPWQPGDVVIAADQTLYVRNGEDRHGDIGYPWHEGAKYAPEDPGEIPGGDTPDCAVPRPITLLVRGGVPAVGIPVDDRALRGEVVER